MLFLVTKRKRPSYSLIELLIVIAVISLIAIASIPGLFNRNDRLSLDTSANQLRQMILEAETRSKAPDKTDAASAAQIYQVAVGKFSACSSNCGTPQLAGSSPTTAINLERGLAQCGSGDLQSGFTTLRSLKLPRGIFVSNFYPVILAGGDSQAVIRFTVGQDGFACGSYSNPQVKSTDLSSSVWVGSNSGNASAARYLVVTLSSQKVSDKRFVTIDRATDDVEVSRTNPQSYFTPVVDSLAPRWTDMNTNNYNLSIVCGPSSSIVLVSFPRAEDRVNDPTSLGDPNLLVTYDINWNTGSADQPIATGYFEDLSHSTVNFQFTTTRFSVNNQPSAVTVKVTAVDALGLAQSPYVATDPNNPLNQRSKQFNPSCGHGSDHGDMTGPNTICNSILYNDNKQWWRKISFGVIKPALAQVPAGACPAE